MAPLPVEITPPARSAIPLHVDRKLDADPQPVLNPRLRPKSSVPCLRSNVLLSPDSKKADSVTKPANAARPEARRNRALEALDKLLEQEAFSLAALELDDPSSSPGKSLQPEISQVSAQESSTHKTASITEIASSKAAAKKSFPRLRPSFSLQSLRKPLMENSGIKISSGHGDKSSPLANTAEEAQSTSPHAHLARKTSQQDVVTSGPRSSQGPAHDKEPNFGRKIPGQRHISPVRGVEPSLKTSPRRRTSVEPHNVTNGDAKSRISSGQTTTEPKRMEIKPPELHTDRRIHERQQKAALQESKELSRPRVISASVQQSSNTLPNPSFHKFRGSRSMGNLAAAKGPASSPLQHSLLSEISHSASSHKLTNKNALRRKPESGLSNEVSAAPRRADAPQAKPRLTLRQSSSSNRIATQLPARRDHSMPLGLPTPSFRESAKSSPQTSPSHSPNATPTSQRPSSVRSFSRKLLSALKKPSSRLSTRSSRPETPSSYSGLSRSTTDNFVDEDFFEEWPEPPRLVPSSETRKALSSLFAVSSSLVDIDPNLTTIPVEGQEALEYDQHLSLYERQELLDYRAVYFTGSPDLVKPAEDQFRDADGNYQFVPRDHIAYRYRVESQLGVGSFGKVLKCRDYRSGRLVAVKVTAIRKELAGQAKVEAHLLNTLKKAGSPDEFHFVRVLDSFMFRGHMCIVTEMLGPNLYEILKRNHYQGLPLSSVQFITKQLCRGLEFLDNQGIIHCDLKPENILVSDDANCQVKIIDFGSGCHEKKRVFTYIQSRFYRAPEILLGIPYSPAIDMWSLGCIIPELLLGRPLFPGEDEKDQVALLCQTLGAPEIPLLMRCSRARHFFDPRGMPLSLRSPKGQIRRPPGYTPLSSFLPPTAANFVKQLLQWSPQKRLSAGGALYHDFLTNL